MKRFLCSICFVVIIQSASFSQIVPVRQVVSTAGKDTLIGSTIWAHTVGEAVITTLTSGLELTQGFHQPDGYSITPFFPFIQNLSIYPNPGSPNSKLYFYLKADKPDMTIKIYDGQGRMFLNQKLESFAGQTIHSLNPQIMAAGVYIVKVFVGTETYMGRYVVGNK